MQFTSGTPDDQTAALQAAEKLARRSVEHIHAVGEKPYFTVTFDGALDAYRTAIEARVRSEQSERIAALRKGLVAITRRDGASSEVYQAIAGWTLGQDDGTNDLVREEIRLINAFDAARGEWRVVAQAHSQRMSASSLDRVEGAKRRMDKAQLELDAFRGATP